MRDDRQRLVDIIEATRLLQAFQANRKRDDLAQDPLLRSALLHQLFVIGEAATRLSQSLKDRYTAIPWRDLRVSKLYSARIFFSGPRRRLADGYGRCPFASGAD